MGRPALFFVEEREITSAQLGVVLHRSVSDLYTTPAKKAETGGIYMYDCKSDYALNKQAPDAIVCKSVTGVHIRLTRADFASEAEFQRWKDWSDQDYRDTEAAGRGFYDNSFPLDERFMAAGPSMEELLLEVMEQTKREQARTALVKQIRSRLTEKQLRRLRLYYLEGKSEYEIAELEHVRQQRISRSLLAGKAALEKILRNFSPLRG